MSNRNRIQSTALPFRGQWLPGRAILIAVLATTLTAGLAFPDNYNGAPAAHVVLLHTPAQIGSHISSGWRPTSIELETSFPASAKYRVSYVRNEATHYREVQFASSETEAQLNARQANGWRVEDVETVSAIGGTRLSAILIRSTHSPQETFYFQGWNADSITLKLALWNGRLIDLDRHVVSGIEVYSGVMVKNTGASQATGAWAAAWSWTQIGNYASANAMRVIDLDRHPDGTYAVVFVKRKAGERTTYFGNRTLQQVQDLIAGGGFRVTSLNETSVDGARRYSGATVNNTNPVAARVASLILPRHNGFQGLYLRQMNGPEIVNLNGARAFHPSSAIKFLVHFHAADVTPEGLLNVRWIGLKTMRNRCRNMMLNSDNPDTNALMSFFGKPAIQDNGRADGPMSTSTALINDMGTGGPYTNNPFTTTTLQDMSRLYERVQIGNTLGPIRVSWIRENMRNQSNAGADLFAGVNGSVRTQTFISPAKYDNWLSQVQWIYKAGNNNDTDPLSGATGYWTCCGSISLPFKAANGTVTHRHYMFGLFVNESTVFGFSNGFPETAELLREQILASMTTFK